MTPSKRKIVNLIIALLLVAAPVQFTAAALHVACSSGDAAVMASLDELAGSAALMNDEATCQQGAHHHCISCVSCCAADNGASTANTVDSALQSLPVYQLAAPFISPSFRPPILL